MAKNVKITEDGSTKIIENAARIRTSLEGGGTCDWIPKDDVPLQELTVTEDGVYRPEEGYYGFSKVTANGVGNAIEGDLIEKTVTKNGTYNIADESGSPYGYSKIIVNVDTSEDDGGGSGGGGSSPVVGKDEDGNDTMAETDDDGNVVITALPTEIKVIIPPTKLDYTRYEEIDYSGISVYAYISKMVHWLGTTTTAVSEGSSNNTVSIGGNSVTASVGDGVLYAPDRTGTNDVQLVWDGTKWVKSENYKAKKEIWKSNDYETGRIPFEELIFPIKRINYDDIIEQKKVIWKSSELPYSPAKIKLSNGFGVIMSNKRVIVTWKDRVGPYSGWITGGGYPTETKEVEFLAQATYNVISTRSDTYMAVIDFNPTDSAHAGYATMLLLIACPYDAYLDGALTTNSDWWGMYFENSASYKSFIPGPSDINNVVRFPHSHPEYYDDETVYIGNENNKRIRRTKNYEYIPFDDLYPSVGNFGVFIPVPYIYQHEFSYDQYKNDKFYITINGGSTGGSTSNHNSFIYKDKRVNYFTAFLWLISHSSYDQRENLFDISLTVPSYKSEDIVEHHFGGGQTAHYDHMAWTMVYGDETEVYENSSISLPVQWKRPGDGKILETTFTAWMKDDGGNGSAPGPGPAPTPPPPR